MSESPQVLVDAQRWRAWQDDINSSHDSAKKIAYLLAGLVTLLFVVIGLSVYGVANRLPVFVYSCVPGALVWIAVVRFRESRGIAPIASSVRALFVPALVEDLTDKQALHLVRFGMLMAAGEMLRATTQGDHLRFALYDPSQATSGGGFVGDAMVWGGDFSGGDFGGGGGDGGGGSGS